MKRWLSLLILFLLCLEGGAVCASEITFQSGYHYDWWKNDDSESGNQQFVPVQIDGVGDDFSVRLLTAFASTKSDLDDVGDSRLSSLVDTKVNLSYGVVDKLPVNLLFGLDVNLPTGEADLDAKDVLIVTDPDLVSIAQHGEGFNVNPTISMTKEWANYGAGLAAGFLWRGEYDYSIDFQNYDPGEIAYLTGDVRYYFSDTDLVRLYGDYGTFSKDKLDDDDFYREADFFLVGAEGRRLMGDWETRLNVKGVFRGKSEFREEVSNLKKESKEGYGDEYVADLLFSYNYSEKVRISPFLQLLYVDDNKYDSQSALYIGERKKYSIGCSLKRVLTDNLNLQLMVSLFDMEDEQGWLATDDVDYRGHSFMLQFVGTL
ncbi:MAG: hypothetical protein HY885_04215 [Deltaproteobacteria bacterium]|nr:hypothetical protein [Deltaproteobacteria bacterium]